MIVKMSTENGSTLSKHDQKIIRQIEYYFGDFNLPKDRFLQEEVKKEDGWVSLETMTKFKRLASITTDLNVIAEALRKSTHNVMEVNEEGSKIRRRPDYKVPESMKEVYAKYEDRTAFVKGFGKDLTLDDMEDYFDKTGVVVNIVMRRRPLGKDFKGSVFVSFKEKEDCDKFLTSDDYKTYNDVELIRKLRTEYVKEKTDARQEAKAKNAESRADAEGKRAEMQKARMRSQMTLGALLELTGVPTDVPEQQVIVRIKSMMKEAGTSDVAYVETGKLKEGLVVVRFKEENMAAEALAKLQERENGLKFSVDSNKKPETESKPTESGDKEKEEKMDSKVEEGEESEDATDAAGEEKAEEEKCEVADMIGRVLVGEEEETAWQNILKERQQRANKRKGGFNRRGGRDGEPHHKRGRYSN